MNDQEKTPVAETDESGVDTRSSGIEKLVMAGRIAIVTLLVSAGMLAYQVGVNHFFPRHSSPQEVAAKEPNFNASLPLHNVGGFVGISGNEAVKLSQEKMQGRGVMVAETKTK